MFTYGRLAILLIGSIFLGDDLATPSPAPSTQPPAPKDQKKPAELPPVLPPLLTPDEQLLKSAEVKDPVEFLRNRTLTDSDRPKIKHLIRLLGSVSYHERERAMFELIHRGPVVAELLREAAEDSDPEISRRAEKCLSRIQEKDVSVDVPAAVIRQLALRKPSGAVEVLLAYVPVAAQNNIVDEIRDSLAKLATVDGKPSPLLVESLEDKLPLRRAVAGESLCLAKAAQTKEAVRKLLSDPEPVVRLRVGLVLAEAHDESAIPVLIDVLPLLPFVQACQAEDLLFRLGDGNGKKPPAASLGADEASRKKCRDAWQAWWQKEGKNIDLAKLGEAPRQLGFTVVVLLDEGKVIELGADNLPRWQVANLLFPLDVQPLPGDRFLVAEYYARKVTERNFKGEVLWELPAQSETGGPLVAQRLPNGHTFIATDTQMFEVDRENKQVMTVSLPNRERITKAQKLPNDEIACLTELGRVVRLDSTGKELSSFTVELGLHLFGGRLHMLPNGRVLVPHNAENKVVEYDSQGKAVWAISVASPITAIRLPNGNTLVTSMLPDRGAVEFSREGAEVWTYHVPTRVTRAIRR